MDKPAFDTLEVVAGIHTAEDTEPAEYTPVEHAEALVDGLPYPTTALALILRPSYTRSAIVHTPQSHVQTHSSYSRNARNSHNLQSSSPAPSSSWYHPDSVLQHTPARNGHQAGTQVSHATS